MSIKIEQLLPLLKEGYVAMDKDGDWYWYKSKPELIDNPIDGHWRGSSCSYVLNNFFDIEPVENWTKSLMECGK